MTSIRRRWTRYWWRRRVGARRSEPVVVAYVGAALLLGFFADDFGRAVLGEARVSPMSSSSATAILSSIASGMMAFTGFVFSLSFVLLQFGTSAYSPRIVQEFSRDRFMSHALGIFTGTFLFALLAIRTVDIEGGPGINTGITWIALAWLLASVSMVALMLPRVRGLSISYVLTFLSRRGGEAIEAVYPQRLSGAETARAGAPPPPTGSTVSQVVRHIGPPAYVHALDVEKLVSAARDAGGVVSVPRAVGDLVFDGEELALVLGASRAISAERMRGAILTGPQRSLEAEPEYAIRLLVDIAIRALSPAINDPATAVASLDQIESLLRRIGRARLDVGRAADDEGQLRLVFETPTWEDFLSLGLSEIQHYGRESVQIQRRLGALLRDLAASVPPSRRPAVQSLIGRRAESISAAVPPEERAEASALDRQGLGHTAA